MCEFRNSLLFFVLNECYCTLDSKALAVYGQVTRNPLTPSTSDDPPKDPTGSETPSKSSTHHGHATTTPSSPPKNEDSVEGHWVAKSGSYQDLREPSKKSSMGGMSHFTAANSPTRPQF